MAKFSSETREMLSKRYCCIWECDDTVDEVSQSQSSSDLVDTLLVVIVDMMSLNKSTR